MKRRAIRLGIFLLAVWTAVILIGYKKRKDTPASPVSSMVTQAPDGVFLTTFFDPVQVFQKAFWRRPSQDDVILHAERREWSASADDVKQWRWFLAVKPGPALRDWLVSNPFSLVETSAPDNLAMAPDWFPKFSKQFIIQQKADGGLTFMWSADRQLLYASDSGYGFAAPSAEP